MGLERKNKMTTNEKISITIEKKANASEEENIEELSENQLRQIIARQKRRSSYIVEEIVNYCIPLVKVEFAGQSNTTKSDETDGSETVLNLGVYLSLLDRVIRKYKDPLQFTIKDEEYCSVLRLVATKRCLKKETTEECYERLLKDSEEFEKIYHERKVLSEVLKNEDFWGTRQQLLCGKVISDWIDTDHLPIDPIFGALLCPCGGRVGPGDSGWVHNLLYDDRGFMAYHSAVHDAFGYLIIFHRKGPGYDYLKRSVLSKFNPFSGQYDGIQFWKKFLEGHKMPEDFVNSSFLVMLGGLDDDGKVIC
ncbi:uncharacterized protein [Clytia hemisphaerica]|uniref:uncharacterized protein isoform X2 n=1 Tax=Clytia hemisphaerica TaxID=252671 RepID=UPI0034D50EA4